MTKAEFDAALAAIREGKTSDNDCEARVGMAIAVALNEKLGLTGEELWTPTKTQVIELIDTLDKEDKQELKQIAESLPD